MASDEKFTLGGSEFQTCITRSVKKNRRGGLYYTDSAICILFPICRVVSCIGLNQILLLSLLTLFQTQSRAFWHAIMHSHRKRLAVGSSYRSHANTSVLKGKGKCIYIARFL